MISRHLVDLQRFGDRAPTVIRGSNDAYGSWNTIWISRRSLRSSLRGMPMSSRPSKRTDPPVGRAAAAHTVRPSTCRSRSRRRGPSVPRGTVNDTPDTAWTRRLVTRRPLARRTGKTLTRSFTSTTGSSAVAPFVSMLMTGRSPGRRGRRLGCTPLRYPERHQLWQALGARRDGERAPDVVKRAARWRVDHVRRLAGVFEPWRCRVGEHWARAFCSRTRTRAKTKLFSARQARR